jgi:SAM-dependent methyltransferase
MIENAEVIRAAVGQRFAQVARSPDQERKLPVGLASAKTLGYGPQVIDALPASVTESFCSVGNPLGLGEVRPGQPMLDLGSGTGLDRLLAAWRVGPAGKVYGVDLCPEMVEKARRNASLLGLHNVEFLQAQIEKLPLPDASVDVVISNGVFNLCPDKPGVLAEAFRGLRLSGLPLRSSLAPTPTPGLRSRRSRRSLLPAGLATGRELGQDGSRGCYSGTTA